MSKRFIYLSILFGLIISPSFSAQEILTASAFFSQISQKYADISDYIADFQWVTDEQRMEGKLFYKNPSLLRMDFLSPENQVIVADDKQLQVYIPQYNVVLRQEFDLSRNTDVSGLLSASGLQLLSENYSIAYQSGPTPLPLESNPLESVYVLRLLPRISNPGFRSLTMYISTDLMIRQVKAITVDNQTINLYLEDVLVNQNLTQATFDYDPPGSANMYDGFLY